MKRLLTLSLAALLAAGLTACGAAEERGDLAAKPVIYLYPEEETQVNVKLDYDGTLTSTYPSYENGWTVDAAPDGTLTDPSTGRQYYCLYWEGETDAEYDFSTGFCVAGADTAAFLEDALADLGLTEQEANEFIIYWLPRMEVNDWNLISFQTTAYTDSAVLTIDPAPDTLIRVFMAWQGLDEPVNPRRFPMAAFTVNAAASRNTNTLIFPAGILQAPFYDKNASFEANLGAIGSTIAHEITHMFDDGGAQYDATGTVRNWWADSDYTHFQTLCKKAEHFYDGYEAAPGIPANGKETLSETISDIGGVACGLEVLSTMENPDYDAFFRSFARQWLRAGSYETLAGLAQSDVHAPNILRTNRVLSNFQEFFDTYGIQPGDGMYVAPEDRIVIW